MSNLDITIPTYSTPYGTVLSGNLEDGLARTLHGPMPHALTCSFPAGGAPRLVDFSAWRRTGAGNFASCRVSTQGALCIAAFQIAGQDGFLHDLPSHDFKKPICYFMTHAALVFDRASIDLGDIDPESPAILSRSSLALYTRGPSAHAVMQSQSQLRDLVETLFHTHKPGIRYRFVSPPCMEPA